MNASSAGTHGGPPAEVDIDAALVVALLRDQHPDLARLEVRAVGDGWDNAVFRVGPTLAARLPRRAVAAPLVAHEQRWLPVLAPRLPLATPRPVRTGVAGHGYPYAWSIVPWYAGHTLLDVASTAGSHDAGARTARRLGRFLRALHRPAAAAAPVNHARGIALAERRARTVAQGASHAELAAFDACATAHAHHGPPVWLHGDLHPGNVVVDDRSCAVAVIDFGDLTAGDPAVDLAIGWMCFGEATRRTFLDAAGADRATQVRARAWAIALAVAYRDGAPDDARFTALAARTLGDAMR